MKRRFLAPFALAAAIVVSQWAFLLGGSFAQTPGSGPNVGATAPYGPPFQAGNGHFQPGNNVLPPTLSGNCGTGAVAPVGTDTAFHFTTGTSPASSCAVNPNRPYALAPTCIIAASSGAVPAYSVSATGVITVTGAAASLVYSVHCFAVPGGL